MFPLEDVEKDLKETKEWYRLWGNYMVFRTFLTEANPFVLKADRLLKIVGMIHLYFPKCQTIGCFSRITDITIKTDGELKKLQQAGFDGLTISIETGDDEALKFMNKGYLSKDIVEQCRRLDVVEIGYSFFYLTSISGAERGKGRSQRNSKNLKQASFQTNRSQYADDLSGIRAV